MIYNQVDITIAFNRFETNFNLSYNQDRINILSFCQT